LETTVKAFPQMQQAIIWCKLDGMSNREICKELGILDGKFYREMNKIKETAERLIGRRPA
jgi:transposase